jgi:DNA-directed RNA polymerase specialized sigma24 family protein
VTMEARAQLIDYLASPQTRSSLRAYVRRRGLSDSADDLVQTVLCDALAVEAVPERSSELPRFVTGIARNKVVDEQRRRARWKQAELPENLATLRSDEARDLLRRIEAEVTEPEERRALAWLVREHQGDSLYLLALEQSLEPSTLRERICRLRRSLRARYLMPLLVLLALGGGTVAVQQALPPSGAPASAAISSYAGNWRVVDASSAKYRGLTINVSEDGRHVRVTGAKQQLLRELTLEASGSAKLRVRSGNKLYEVELRELPGARLRLSTRYGFVELAR